MIPGYRDFSLVARGGFSEVYTAHQEAFDRTVAVKVITIELSEDTLRRFGRELTTVGRLDGHPHVIRVYESGFTDQGRPYLTMEHHPGGSLADRLGREGPLPVPEVLDIGVKLASALAAAHDSGVLHRDIKPQNVLLSAFHGPLLADFGIAMFDSSQQRTLTGEAFSALHVAPEVLDGHPPTKAADLYSLASTLYELLAGAAPFAAEDGLLALMRRVRTQAVPPIERNDVPPRLAAELETLLARDPDRRPSSAQELAGRLRDVQAELGHDPTPLVPAPAATLPGSVPPGSEPAATATTPPMATPSDPRAPVATPPSRPAESGDQPDPVADTGTVARAIGTAVPTESGTRRRPRWRLPVAGAAAVLLVVGIATAWAARDDDGDPVVDRDDSRATTTTLPPTTTTGDTATTVPPALESPPSGATPAPDATPPIPPADGRDDLVYVEAEGSAAYFANVEGAANRWGSRTVIGEGWHPTRVHLADLDGDGKDDRVYVGVDGTAHFFANVAAPSNRWGPDRVIGQGWDPARVQFADLDGDGKDDWLYLGEDAVMRYHQNVDGPAGSWGPAKEISFGWDANRIKFADLDGDGKDDQIAVWGDGDASFWVNVDLPNKVQGPERPLGTDWDPARVQFADLDGDGRDDLIEVTASGVTRFHANSDGTRTWGPAVELGTSWDPARLRFADLG